ncbi:TIGR02757 family protein [Algivirga pacifica]|uniref:TIGR02757 family protein n=1 Tax=Algivirga pacifica TaxID=1162670 RepID=A0ABP9DLQ4_9BACT
MKSSNLFELLEEKVAQYNRPSFIEDDPISIPHLFEQKQDIEIMGLWASLLAWGQRKTIINKCHDLLERMDHAPYDFIMNHQEDDLKKLLGFKHRTFNDTDTLYFIEFFKFHYQQHDSLESAFSQFITKEDDTVEKALIGFRTYFFSIPDAPERTQKHIATPARKSACKRLNMFLRWMVRKDAQGVDFGIWDSIQPSQLVCPLDVHVDRVAKKLGLLHRTQSDWKAALELTNNLKKFSTEDPVKYDFALFGMGIEGEI